MAVLNVYIQQNTRNVDKNDKWQSSNNLTRETTAPDNELTEQG
jgi:hypothetical protein